MSSRGASSYGPPGDRERRDRRDDRRDERRTDERRGDDRRGSDRRSRSRERGDRIGDRNEREEDEESAQPKASGSWDPVKEAENDPAWARIYISNLPDDVTSDELQELFGALGVVAREKQKRGYKDQWPFKIKVYTDAGGRPKGDAVLTYEDSNAARTAPSFFDGGALGFGHLLFIICLGF